MKAQHSASVYLGLAALVAEAHLIATGSEISLDQAARYFHDPAQFAATIRASGALGDPRRSGQLRSLLAAAGKEKRNGI
jgi:hypothetical protein